jgi:hypothetical protein
MKNISILNKFIANKIIIIILFSVITLSFNSCERTVGNIELPYVEQLVIKCVLEPGKLVEKVRVEKTLPPLDSYSPDKALVSDAKFIINDGTQDYVLQYANGYYYSYELIPQEGKYYNMRVEWKNKVATAETYIPPQVTVEGYEFKIITNTGLGNKWYDVYLYFKITPVSNAVYQGGILQELGDDYRFYNDPARYEEKDINNKLNVKMGNYYYSDGQIDTNNLYNEIIAGNTFAIASYDKSYYNYWITQYNGDTGSGIFSGGGLNISWNIEGDGIGLFIGRNITVKEF